MLSGLVALTWSFCAGCLLARGWPGGFQKGCCHARHPAAFPPHQPRHKKTLPNKDPDWPTTSPGRGLPQQEG